MAPRTKESQNVKQKKKRTFLRRVNEEQYDTLFQLVQGKFKIPRSKQTQQQKNAVRQYQRRKSDFHINSRRLYFQGKQVMPASHVPKAVTRTLKRNLGSGSRSTWWQIKRTRAGVSYDMVKRMLRKSHVYTRHRPSFRNKIPPKSIISSLVNERWQIDLINMQGDEVSYNGKPQKYILSIIDTFSRFLFLRPLPQKTSAIVAENLERVFAEHGVPKIIQCDQGTEFKGEVDKLLQRRGVKVIRSSAYHPQSQGKCERSHRDVRSKIHFKIRQQGGFNWARNLFEVQEAINNVPKEVLGNWSPAEVYTNRGNASLCQEVRKASKMSRQRTAKRISRRIRTSVYREGEKVLIRYPPKGGSKLVPRKRYTCKGVIEKRKLAQNKYKVKLKKPDGKEVSQWISVSDITSETAQKEKLAAKRKLTEELKKDLRQKYYIPLTHKDRINHLKQAQIKVLYDPKETIGSCQFESVSHQLSLFGIHRSPQRLRQEAVEHIREFPTLYNDFLVGNPAVYLEEMKKKSTYGDNVTLLALSRLYNVQFLIASADGPEYTALISSDGEYSEQMFLLTLGYFPEGRGEHYVSIGVDSQTKRALLSHVCIDREESPMFSEETDTNNRQGLSDVDRGHEQLDQGQSDDDAGQGQSDRDNRQGESYVDVGLQRSDHDEGQGQSVADVEKEQSNGDEGQTMSDRKDEQGHSDGKGGQERSHYNGGQRTSFYDEGQGRSDGDDRKEDRDRQKQEQWRCGEQEQSDHDERPSNYDVRQERSHLDDGQRQSDDDDDDDDENPTGHAYRYENHLDQANDISEFLPREIQLIIVRHVLNISPASRYTLRMVNTFFRDVVAALPLPQLHINWAILPYIPRPVSVRRIVLAAGRGSGLALEIRRILASPRWFHAWLWLREEEHRRFAVTHVWYRVGWP